MKLSLSVFGSTTSTVEAPRGAQYSRLSGPAQIPLFSLPCFLPLRPPVPEPVNGGRRCRACGAFRRPPLAVRRACLKPLRLALAWPKSARIGSYGQPRHLWSPLVFRFNSLLGALGPVFGWSGPLFWGLLPLLAGSCLSKASPDAKCSPPGSMLGFFCPPKSIIFTRCLKSCPCAFIGAFFGCFRRRCSSYLILSVFWTRAQKPD